MNKPLSVTVAILLAAAYTALADDQDFDLVVNAAFSGGLKGWQTNGDVHIETNSPLGGKVSAVIGPGSGSLSQRIEISNINPFTVSALVQSKHTNGWVLTVRFLDKSGREIMTVDSPTDITVKGINPQRIDHYMQPHPLTKWVQLVISNDSPGASVVVDDVGLDMPDENAANLKPTCDLDEAMRPFWLGKTAYNESVLMLSQDGRPASGQLMFHPTRIISVRDYGLVTNYSEGRDYAVVGGTLVCTASSRMPQMRDKDIQEGEFKWNVIGGKQVMVTYEHDDTWNHPYPAYVGDGLPGTIKKLKARAPLTIVAYGDSITHGYGESRLSHIRPFLPPWPELFVHRLKEIYHDPQIQFYNSSQSGATSQWGKDYAGRMVASLDPDLVLVAFGQNDFWSISPDSFATNIADIMQTVRKTGPNVEFILVSTLRFDPAYTTNSEYWHRVGEYAQKLEAMTKTGVQFVDMTAIGQWVYTAKRPKDCMNDPLHPNDYFARWYAQSLVAALDPGSETGARSTLPARPRPVNGRDVRIPQ